MSQPANTIAFWQAARNAALGRAAAAPFDDDRRRDPQRRVEAAHLQAAISGAAVTIARAPERFDSLRAAKMAAWERMRAARIGTPERAAADADHARALAAIAAFLESGR
jgi:hypothetical protein